MSNLILKPDNKWDRLIGKLRLAFGFCPRCNSDAPAVYTCFVCKQVHINGQISTAKNLRQEYPPNLATKALWWYSWMHPGFGEMQKEYSREKRHENHERKVG